MIRIDNLNVVFGRGDRSVHAVRNTNLEVEAGESFGLVGESGSGKTTVLRVIAGLIESWNGSVQVNDQDIRKQRGFESFRHTQMVFQDPYGALHPRHTVDTIVSEPARIHKLTYVEQRVTDVLLNVGLGSRFRYRYPHQLSGGQRQRVAIARALILQPRLLLLDEPTSALDVSVQAEVLNLLSKLREEHGLTYLLVSHDLAVVAHLCDRLAVMQHGRIVETMTAQQLRTNQPSHEYTRTLMKASEGYDRAHAASLFNMG